MYSNHYLQSGGNQTLSCFIFWSVELNSTWKLQRMKEKTAFGSLPKGQHKEGKKLLIIST
jgi:hypothetical protein